MLLIVDRELVRIPETEESLPPAACPRRIHGPDISRQTALCAKTRVKSIQCCGTWKHLSPGREILVCLRGSRISLCSALIHSWGRASLRTDSTQCEGQEVFCVVNNIKWC